MDTCVDTRGHLVQNSVMSKSNIDTATIASIGRISAMVVVPPDESKFESALVNASTTAISPRVAAAAAAAATSGAESPIADFPPITGGVNANVNANANVNMNVNVSANSIAKGGVPVPFPWRLHDMLDAMEKQCKTDIVTWQPHGRAFKVEDPKKFVEEVMSKYFSQTKYASFQRQLNLYGFSRLGHGRDKGAYYHHCFIKGQRDLVRSMVRRKVKGTMVRKSYGPDQEPNFYDPQWKLQQPPRIPTSPTLSSSTYPSSSADQLHLHPEAPSPPPSLTSSIVASSMFSQQLIQQQQYDANIQLAQHENVQDSNISSMHTQRHHHQILAENQLPPPTPRIHGFVTNVDPRVRLVPINQDISSSTSRVSSDKNDVSAAQDSPLLSFQHLKQVVEPNSCPLTRLAAIAGQFENAD